MKTQTTDNQNASSAMQGPKDHAKAQASAQLESIREMVSDYNKASCAMQENQSRETCGTFEDAEQRIQEDALSVEVRSGWYSLGSDADGKQPEEFNILLCTGGPACRIIGKLNQYQEPESARIEYQDWGTPWTDYPLDSEEESDVLTYCRCFYFGE